ncbi:hypothetical protein F5884DRAFT_745570 [Xylogone sp. PMI_703]|nr:hypothetical protein F5884DRAFT_745570 [Xylogone sp. PMI_703]
MLAMGKCCHCRETPSPDIYQAERLPSAMNLVSAEPSLKEALSLSDVSGFSRLEDARTKSVREKKQEYIQLEKRLSTSRSSRISEGEAERRAELKRIRHRRIQQELSNDTIYDEDARSFNTVGGSPRKSPKDIALPFYPERLVDNQHSHMVNDEIGEHDDLEGKIQELQLDQPNTHKHHVESSEEAMITIDVDSPRNLSYTNSECKSIMVQQLAESSFKYGTSMRPPLPSPPRLKPIHLPSIDEPIPSLWRLSFTSQNRGSCLRSLSLDRTRHHGTHVDKFMTNKQHDDSKLQKQQSALLSDAVNSSPVVPEDFACMIPTPKSNMQALVPCVMDNDGGRAPIIHLQDMNISQKLAFLSTSSLTSSTELPSLEDHTENTDMIITPRIISNEIYEPGGDYSSPRQISPSLKPLQVTDITPFDSPSNHNIPSTPDGAFLRLLSSFTKKNPDTKKSNTNITANDKEGQKQDEKESRPARSSLPEIVVSNSLTSSPTNKSIHFPTNDTSSIVGSDTESFFYRESELRAIRARFAHSKRASGYRGPYLSKFHEEFDGENDVSDGAPLHQEAGEGSSQSARKHTGFGHKFRDSSGHFYKPFTKASKSPTYTPRGVTAHTQEHRVSSPIPEMEIEGWSSEDVTGVTTSKKNKKKIQSDSRSVHSKFSVKLGHHWSWMHRKRPTEQGSSGIFDPDYSGQDASDASTFAFPHAATTRMARSMDLVRDENQEYRGQTFKRRKMADNLSLCSWDGRFTREARVNPYMRSPSRLGVEDIDNPIPGDNLRAREIVLGDITDECHLPGHDGTEHVYDDRMTLDDDARTVRTVMRNSHFRLKKKMKEIFHEWRVTKSHTFHGGSSHKINNPSSGRAVPLRMDSASMNELEGRGSNALSDTIRKQQGDMRHDMNEVGLTGITYHSSCEENSNPMQSIPGSEESRLGIGDPRFYEDCVSHPTGESNDNWTSGESRINLIPTAHTN